MRRLIAACFLKVGGRREVTLLKRIASHNYAWIADKAAARFAEIGRAEDLDGLVETLLATSDQDSGERVQLLEALVALDRKLFPS